MKEIIIDLKDENQRLDKFLLKYLNKAPKSFIYKMLRKKNIKYNNKKAEGNEILEQNNSIQLYLSDETLKEFKEIEIINKVEKTFDIIYEDENILVCNKPINLLVQKNTAFDNNTLVDQLIYYLYQSRQYNPDEENGFKPAICNRLDRNTSGLVLAGKNLMTLQGINKAIHDNKVDKYYKTIVKGNIKQAGILESYHIKDENTNEVKIIDKQIDGAKKVITKYRPLKTNGDYTLLEIELITGKTHQIRAHLKSINHPVIGDTKYGEYSINRFFNRKYRLEYQFLHAYKFVFREMSEKLQYLANKSFEAEMPNLFKIIENDLFGLK